jgi:hypothetical protein
MKLLPDRRNLNENRLFSLAYYGELLGLALGVLAIINLSRATFEYTVGMLCVLLVRAFLIWAWGRRYPWVDWIYAAWNVPTVVILTVIAVSAAWSLAQRGQIIDGSINLLGWVAMATAIVSRSTGLFWCVFGSKTIEFRETSQMPAIILICALIFAAVYIAAEPRRMDFPFVMGMGFYGLGISI